MFAGLEYHCSSNLRPTAQSTVTHNFRDRARRQPLPEERPVVLIDLPNTIKETWKFDGYLAHPDVQKCFAKYSGAAWPTETPVAEPQSEKNWSTCATCLEGQAPTSKAQITTLTARSWVGCQSRLEVRALGFCSLTLFSNYTTQCKSRSYWFHRRINTCLEGLRVGEAPVAAVPQSFPKGMKWYCPLCRVDKEGVDLTGVVA